jgi:hypothetical protein
VRIVLVHDNPEFASEIRYTFEVLSSIMGIDSHVIVLSEAGAPKAFSQTHDLVLTYCRCPCSVSSRCEIRIRPSHLFGDNYLTSRSLPEEPLPSTKDGLPIIYRGQAVASEVWVTREANVIDTNIDIIASSFFLLSLYEEIMTDAEDEHSRFPFEASLAYRAGFWDRPLVNEYAELLWTWLEHFQIGIERRDTWHGRDFAFCLTHDIDILRRYEPRADWHTAVDSIKGGHLRYAASQACNLLMHVLGVRQDPFDVFDYMLTVEKECDIRSSFYFLTVGRGQADPVAQHTGYEIQTRHLAKTLRKVLAAECEVGLHTSYDAFADESKIRAEKEALELVLQRLGAASEPMGCRQHFVRWKTPQSWRARQGVGFAYDSSITYASHGGFRCGICVPFRPYDLAERVVLDFYELPPTIMDATLSYHGYRNLSPIEGAEVLYELTDKVRQVRGVLVLVWHNTHLAEEHYPGWRETYEAYLRYMGAQNAFRETAKDVVYWWDNNQIAEPSGGGCNC